MSRLRQRPLIFAIAALAALGAAAYVYSNRSTDEACRLENTAVDVGPGIATSPEAALAEFVAERGGEFGLTNESPDAYESTGPGLGGPIVFRQDRIGVTVEVERGKSWVSAVTRFHGDCRERYGVG